MGDKVQQEWWGHQLDAVMEQIAREAWICDVKLLDPGMIEAVLQDNAAACGSTNPVAFKKLRDLLMMGFVVREKAFDRMGADEADAMIRVIRESLQKRFGDRLGGASGRT